VATPCFGLANTFTPPVRHVPKYSPDQ
jgi:hypothetical protein